jgi:hypothetical protein
MRSVSFREKLYALHARRQPGHRCRACDASRGRVAFDGYIHPCCTAALALPLLVCRLNVSLFGVVVAVVDAVIVPVGVLVNHRP